MAIKGKGGLHVSTTTLVILGVLIVAAAFGYLWFRRMKVHPSDDPQPPEQGTE